MPGNFLIYGATGYTGRLIAREAVKRGLRPILAARDPAKFDPWASQLGLDCRSFSVEDRAGVDEALSSVSVLLNVAGPFSATSRQLLDGCMRTRTHYLDITGEIDVLEASAARDAEAKREGITVLPGIGFDVVPSDCLAAHVKSRLPGATRLVIAIDVQGGISRGTTLTGLEAVGQGTRARRDGRIVTLQRPLRREVDFGDGAKAAVAVSWGDVATAYYSTGIPDITVFFRATGAITATSGLAPWSRRLLSTPPAQALLRRLIGMRSAGPTDGQRAAGRAILIGEAEDPSGLLVRSRLETIEAYTLTAHTSLAAVERMIEGKVAAGFQTPSTAFGAGFVLAIPGTRLLDL